jgi:hypothetical protein
MSSSLLLLVRIEENLRLFENFRLNLFFPFKHWGMTVPVCPPLPEQIF